jgi:hypothetical protein
MYTRVDTYGCTDLCGQTARKPSEPTGTTVAFTAYARPVAGVAEE